MCLFPPFFILYYVLTKLILFLYTVCGSVRWLVRLFLVLDSFSLNAPSLGMRVCVCSLGYLLKIRSEYDVVPARLEPRPSLLVPAPTRSNKVP